MTLCEDVAEMLLAASTTAGDDGYGERIGQFPKGLVGIAVLCTVVVHARKENLAGTALLSLTSPLE